MEAPRKQPEIARLCGLFPDAFATDQASAVEQGTKYFIHRVIGTGATGTVFGASRVADSSRFAVKCVDMEGMKPADRSRAQTEVECLLNCDFFSVLKGYDDYALMDDKDASRIKALAVVVDYANAGDLRHEVRRRMRSGTDFPEEEIGMLFIQILLAVHHVHSKHMIHRDIKSGNILLCSNGLVKLGDFGFSRTFSSSVSGDVANTFCGTPYYVAPEVWRRETYSKKADMFSLGVVLYELLTLQRPFEGEDMHEVMRSTLAGRYRPLDGTVSPEMASVCNSLLSLDPAKRPDTTELLRSPLARLFLAGLVGVMNTNTTFTKEVRTMVLTQIEETRQGLSPPPQPKCDDRLPPISPTGTMAVAATSTDEGDDILIGGRLRKQGRDGRWKMRYVCVRRASLKSEDARCGGDIVHSANPSPPDAAAGSCRFYLMMGLSEASTGAECVMTPFSEVMDVIPVPNKYSGTRGGHVFAIILTSGYRLQFQGQSEVERGKWLDVIQETLDRC